MSKFALIALAMLLSTQAQARTFYKATMKLSLQYTNINDGTVDLLEKLVVGVQYSDDHDFCRVVVGNATFKCHSYHNDEHPDQVAITIDRGLGGQMIATALAQRNCDPNVKASFARLATYLDDTIDIEWQGRDFYQQIHDEQPESFHIWIYEMSQGVKY